MHVHVNVLFKVLFCVPGGVSLQVCIAIDGREDMVGLVRLRVHAELVN